MKKRRRCLFKGSKSSSEKRESHNKGKSYEKGQFQGYFKCSKMDHLIKDCPLLKEEQRKNSKRQQQLASKAFKKAMKATWGETSDEESEGEDGENDNLTLMAKSGTDSDNDSTESFRSSSNPINPSEYSNIVERVPALNIDS
ncbi:hypothetical protein HAX54_033371 [Datura stramonium]|uniref:Uncharacterized protein n=1 Tax=Datura stramonium TaxID=4076 RepID=A0ABS8VFC4_DATST|nr:hypothetical protein [Datura stramonium]